MEKSERIVTMLLELAAKTAMDNRTGEINLDKLESNYKRLESLILQ